MSPPSPQPAADPSPIGGQRSALAMFRSGRTAFFGRDDDVAYVLSLVRDPAVRLVTLIGPGGVGKTTLALETLARIHQEGANEVVFVPLADVRDRDIVNMTIAAALGIDPGKDRSPIEDIAASIGDREIVLAIDNLEHLLPLNGGVATLLTRCPELTVLATSRIPLHIAGEHRVTVPPLPLARPEESFDALAGSPAVRLFATRARTANPAFRLLSENAPVIASICRRVDGLPLAIELAAASSRFYSPDAILTRLDTHAMPLAGSDRDLPARQQSMYRAIAWSYDLLDKAAQALFTALGVFVGGFTAEAAEAILPMLFSVEQLDGLVEHGLVLQTANVLGEPRFTMLETIREFAEEHLCQSAGGSALREEHALYFMQLAEALEPELMSADPTACFIRIEADLPNYRAALDWLRGQGRITEALRLLNALSWFWTDPPYIPEGRTWHAALLDDAGTAIPAAIRAKAWSGAGALANLHGDLVAARVHYEHALPLWSQAGIEPSIGSTKRALGMIALQRGDHDQAEQLLREALDIALAGTDRWEMAAILQSLGFLNEILGRHAEALEHYERALEQWRATGHLSRIMLCLIVVGWVHLTLGDTVWAREYFEAGLSLMDDDQNLNDVLDTVTLVYAGYAELARLQGDPRLAVHLLAAATRHRETQQLPFNVPVQRTINGRLGLLRETLGEAAYTVAWLDGTSWSLQEALDRVRALPRPEQAGTESQIGNLSPRETAVLRLLVEGRSDAEIADALFISRKTASNHVAAIIEKLGVSNRTAAATRAIRQDLV